MADPILPVRSQPQPVANRPLTGAQMARGQQPVQSGQAAGATFAQALAEAQQVRFSNHAQKRMQTRDIQLSQENVDRLSNAIDKAEKRGGKNSLVLVDDLAFIVNVHDRLVVTAMETNQNGEGVFTQIDTVVIADAAERRQSGE